MFANVPYSGHSKSDTNVYRTEREIKEWQEKDPILRLREYMIEHGFTEQQLGDIEKQAETDIENAIKFAEDSPYPDPDTIQDGVYA